MSNSEEKGFNYFVSSKSIYMVVSLVGQLSDTAPDSLQPLQTEVRDNTTATVFIFNFRDLVEISGEAVPVLAQIQKDIRTKSGEVRLCGLRPELKAKLLAKGVIRTSEIFDNLQTAIQRPPRPAQKKAS